MDWKVSEPILPTQHFCSVKMLTIARGDVRNTLLFKTMFLKMYTNMAQNTLSDESNAK